MKIIKNPKKIHYILATLFVLNVTAFFTVSAITNQSPSQFSTPAAQDESDAYLESGLDMLNWSYTLIRYFRHPG